jgi:hypothetical protein
MDLQKEMEGQYSTPLFEIEDGEGTRKGKYGGRGDTTVGGVWRKGPLA